MAGFSLHPKLDADTFPVGELDLCTVRLMNDSRWPWVILVPRQPDLRELHDLGPIDQIQLMGEIAHVSQSMQEVWAADKTNIAALGNAVPQLHIHVIMRWEGDEGWPGPVWGVGTAVPYGDAESAETLAMLSGCLPEG